jgi:SpoIID/LytB domain protein
MRRTLPITLAVFALLGVGSAAGAQANVATGGPIGSPVRFAPKAGTTLTLEGEGPFRGTLEVRRDGGALTVVNELDLDHYVMGVREVPGQWPMEALKAQAVAARTYALWEVQKGYWKKFGFDVCATVSCQVYQGATAELGERGRRWAAAVKATSGEILYESPGVPALARYHSTSGGRTVNNEIAFGNDGPRDYLKAVDDSFDKVSPLHRWKQSFKREQLQAILKAAIQLNGTIDEIIVDEQKLTTTIKTLGGELTKRSHEIRFAISEYAPKIYPTLYPGTRSDGEVMPFTLPSSRFTVEKTPEGFIFHGRGYGHGVGMSQYGAMGRAEAGQSYQEILAAYYGGLRPQPWTGHRVIRVAIERGIGSVRITANDAFGVSTGVQVLAGSTFGGWVVTPSGVRSVQVRPPTGHSLPLALTGVRVPDEVVVDQPESGRNLEVGFVVPKSAQVTGVVTREGEEVARKKMVVEAGERTLAIPLDPGKLAGKDNYDVRLTAYDGTNRVEQAGTVVLIKSGWPWTRKALVVLVVLAAVIIWRRRVVAERRRRHRTAEPDPRVRALR